MTPDQLKRAAALFDAAISAAIKLPAADFSHETYRECRGAWAMLDALTTKGDDMSDKTEWVTLESAIEAIEHVSQYNGPGREQDAVRMLDAARRIAELEAERGRLREALKLARNGLQWYLDTFPQAVNGCDDEALAQIGAAIAKEKSE